MERRIRAGQIGENDLLAVLGGAPKPYWHFPRFADVQPAAAPVVQPNLPPSSPSRPSVPAATSPSRPAIPSVPLSGVAQASVTSPRQAAMHRVSGGASGSSIRAIQPAPSGVVRSLSSPDHKTDQPQAGEIPWRAPRPFPDALMRLRPQALRARLLEATLQEVVGAGTDEPPDFALACARARLSQIEALMKPRWFEPIEVAAVTEVMGLVSQGCTLLAFPNLKERLLQREAELGRISVLREVTSLAMPLEDALEQVSGQPRADKPQAAGESSGKRGAMSMITGAVMSVVGSGAGASSSLAVPPAVFLERLTHMRVEDAVGVLATDSPERMATCARERIRQVDKHVAPLAQQSEDRETLHQIRCRIAQSFVVLAHPELSRVLRQRQARLGRALTVAETMDLAPAPADALEVLSATDLKEALHGLAASTILKRSNAGSEERLRELEQLMSAPPELTTEPLQWGSGDEEEGGRVLVAPLLALLFASAAIAFAFPTGVNELLPELDHSIHYGRALALVLAAYFAVRGVRFEAFSRFGWRPSAGWHWALSLGGLMGGVVWATVLKGDPTLPFALTPVLVLALLRGLSEGFFFEGLVARTLLLDVEHPVKAIIVAGSMSALYTGLFVLASTQDMQAASLATVVWWLLVALPASALMWQSRAVSVAMLYRVLAWVAFYLAW